VNSRVSANSVDVGGVSLVVPMLNEAGVLPVLIRQLDNLAAEQVIIVDGGSSDASRHLMRQAGYQVIESPAGRAMQMNAGAKVATQAMLLFLHADTQLPSDYKAELGKAEVWGRFDVRFSSFSKAMKVIAFFMNIRSRISGVSTGDHALFIERSVFESIGGYPELPLMEDVAICKSLRQIHRPYNSRSKVVTSARRWEIDGIAMTVIKMWCLRLAYFLGVSPSTLKRAYDDAR
jgi:rSAM/selenodomain-associated transferase 2